MSYYYSYYIGYRDSSGKIYPYGPYDAFGKLYPVIERSRSYASDLHELFYIIPEDSISNELKSGLGYKDEGKDDYTFHGKYLPLTDLPNGDYIKSGYFLIEDVKRYNKDDFDSEDLFYNMITPDVYAEMLHNQLIFDNSIYEKEDIEGEKYVVPRASDYIRFSAPDYYSKEYEASIIRLTATTLDNWEFFHNKEDFHEMVIIETEG